MGVILGIDIGGSATKIVGLRPDKSVIGMLRVKAEDSITSLYGALGSFLCSNDLTLGDLERIVLTGVGAADAKGDIYGVPTVRVEEFPSIGTGGLALSGKEHAVVVSLGTGTAFIWAD
ncbi:MAG: pantothenate kinase, partial [Oscillospiraceae bacterium]|nr:pantothenate kinase [Oscillospiraceae bacterium]